MYRLNAQNFVYTTTRNGAREQSNAKDGKEEKEKIKQ